MINKAGDDQRIAGLANILKASNKQKEIPPSPAPPQADQAVDTAVAAPVRSRRERTGKRDDPNYHQCGLYIRKTTHKRARRRLEDTQPGKDMSELVQELLEQWLESPR
jgi:hypothetical protein